MSVDNWDVLFDRLTSDGERLVVALDEFQYLGKANPAFPSVFQRIWDTMLSKRNVRVILVRLAHLAHGKPGALL